MLWDAQLLWDGFIYVPTDSKKIVIRVFLTPGCVQNSAFQAALSESHILQPYVVEYLTVDILKNGSYKWTSEDLVTWLLTSHIHFIITHVNQGQQSWQSWMRWDFEQLRIQLQRLKYHNGFPNGENVDCPIFLQNKYEYIKALPDLTNNTLKIEINEENKYDLNSIKRYV